MSTNNKYWRAIELLEKGEEPSMKCFGNSMLPILSNPTVCHYRKQEHYDVGDIVLCKVKGRFIDAHKIIKCNHNGHYTTYLIANNHGHENGWTGNVYGRVFKAELKSGEIKLFERR